MNPSETSGGESLDPVRYKHTSNQTDPLVNFQINNPIPPLKRLLKKIFANEEITIKIPVLTAIAIVAFGLGGASGFITAVKTQLANNIPLVATIFPTPSVPPSPSPWISTTLFGTVSKTSNQYFLISEAGSVVRLLAPQNVNLDRLLGKKILATGLYNKETNDMKVEEAADLLLFSSTAPVPTTVPTPPSPISASTPAF